MINRPEVDEHEEDISSLEDKHHEQKPSKPPVDLTGKVIFRVKIVHSSETELCEVPKDMVLMYGTYGVASTRYGNDLVKILGKVSHETIDTTKEDIYKIERVATQEDINRYEKDKIRAKDAFKICKEKVEKHKLDMKLVSAHYVLDEPKVLFFFTAENRVDFRELVKDLVAVFKMRIELRQIGVRDESRVCGGLGVCGRDYCCHGVTDKLKPVSIRMAKEQNLSLNSMKISGPCGRLLCCLSYEYDFYHKEKGNLPNEGSIIRAGEWGFRILEINILKRIMRIQGEDGRYLTIGFEDIKRSDNPKERWRLDKKAIEEKLKEN